MGGDDLLAISLTALVVKSDDPPPERSSVNNPYVYVYVYTYIYIYYVSLYAYIYIFYFSFSREERESSQFDTTAFGVSWVVGVVGWICKILN